MRYFPGIDATPPLRWNAAVNSGLPPASEPDGPLHVRVRGRRLAYFGGSDYFRLAWHPEVRRFLARALGAGGIDVAASRVTTGNRAVYVQAEKALARWMGTGSATLVSSGYLAPLVAAQALATRCDVAVWVTGAHPCLRDAAAACGRPTAEVQDPGTLAAACQRHGWKRPLLLREGVGALTGRFQPLEPWLAALPPKGFLLFDDAHGVGTLGRKGRGAAEVERVQDPRLLLAFTLSKAFGLYGGVVAGPDWLAAAIWEGSRAARGGTPIPPAYAAAVPEVLRLIRLHGLRWRNTLAGHQDRIREALGQHESPTAADHLGPVFSLAATEPARHRRLFTTLRSAGIEPPFIRYPGGPECGLFRFALSSAHSTAAVVRLAKVLAAECTRAPAGYRWL